ncbi:MAG: helix-hairpin-helix domain-containing protein [Flavobacteriales bacterium]
MLFLCLIIFIIAIYKYVQFNQKEAYIDFSSFKDQIAKLEKQIEIEKKYVVSKRNKIKSTSYTYKKSYPKISVELNSADTTMLKQIYGIGSVLSKRIVRYRDLLGGFHSKNQLLDVYAMDTNVYEDFKHQISVDLSLVQKIDINFVSANELSKHPFISYKLANSIVNYRSNHGEFSHDYELMNLYLIDTVTFNILLPYLDFDD